MEDVDSFSLPLLCYYEICAQQLLVQGRSSAHELIISSQTQPQHRLMSDQLHSQRKLKLTEKIAVVFKCIIPGLE